MILIHRTPIEELNSGYMCIPNAVMRDKTISATARTVLCVMLGSKPDTITTKARMMNFTGVNEKPLNRALKELITAGYVVPVDILWTKEVPCKVLYSFYDTPQRSLQNEDPQNGDSKKVSVYKEQLIMNKGEQAQGIKQSLRIESQTASNDAVSAEADASAKRKNTSLTSDSHSSGYITGRLSGKLHTTVPTIDDLEFAMDQYRSYRFEMLEEAGCRFTEPNKVADNRTLRALYSKDLNKDPSKLLEVILAVNGLTLFLEDHGAELFVDRHRKGLKAVTTMKDHFPEPFNLLAELSFATNLRKIVPKLRRALKKGAFDSIAAAPFQVTPVATYTEPTERNIIEMPDVIKNTIIPGDQDG